MGRLQLMAEIPRGLERSTVVLVDDRIEISPEFIGFTIEDVFVGGYGIDCAEAYRRLRHIGSIEVSDPDARHDSTPA